MIAMLRGNLVDVEANTVIVDVGGVGYQVYATGQVLTQLPKTGELLTIHTFLLVRDDSIVLYGFQSPEEKRLFQKIITVSGAGPKTAIALLSALRPRDFVRAIQQGERGRLLTVSGVGRKTADRLILELRETLGSFFDDDWGDDDPEMPDPVCGLASDAVEALTALEYSENEAQSLVDAAQQELGEAPVELQTLLKAALAKNLQK